MAFVLSSISGNLISAASAGFAPTNSADVSAIASAYQVVSSTATQLYAGTAYVTSVNGAPLSASRAGNAANASLANSAWYDGTGRLISSLPDSAAVSAIASAYAESAASGKLDYSAVGVDPEMGVVSSIDGAYLSAYFAGYAEQWSDASSKQDTLTFAYDDDKISAINGSALAGQGGGGATGDYVEKSATSVAIGTANTAGAWSLVVGSGNKNFRGESLIVGRNNYADRWAVAVGSTASASMDGLAVGYKPMASLGIAVGSEVSGWEAAVGVGNKVYGYGDSIAVGSYSTARNASLSVGSLGLASSRSYALGSHATAIRNSFAHGMYVTADYTAMAFGTYNQSGNGSGSSGAAFVIGDGTASNARHDLMVVTKDGEITMYSGTADTTGTGIMSSIRALSANAGGVDSATVSAIASSYAESAVSSYQPLSGMSSYASAFSAGEGLEFVQSGSDQVLQVEAPVDIVAGPGIVVDNPDGNTLRVSMAADYETVLWDCNGTPLSNTNATATLSEVASNFQYIRFYWMGEQAATSSAAGLYGIKQSTFDMTILETTGFSIGGLAEYYSDGAISLAYGHLTLNEAKTIVTLARQTRYNIKNSGVTDYSTGNGMFKLYRVVGINRISGGN